MAIKRTSLARPLFHFRGYLKGALEQIVRLYSGLGQACAGTAPESLASHAQARSTHSRELWKAAAQLARVHELYTVWETGLWKIRHWAPQVLTQAEQKLEPLSLQFAIPLSTIYRRVKAAE